MTSAARVAMLLHKSVEHDARVRRAGRALAAAGYEVTVLELDAAAGGRLDGFARRSVAPPAWVRRRLPFQLYRVVFLASFVTAILRLRPAVVHAHDAAMLLPGLIGARLTGARLVYDSHELATGVPYREGGWARFVAAVERVAVPRAALVITVTDGIADRLRERYGLERRPVVVRNACDLPPARPDGSLRAGLGLGGAPLVLHQGAAAPARGCEQLVRAMREVPGHLVFLGDCEPGYEARLREVVAEAGLGARVHLRPSVAQEDLLSRTAEADVGVSLLEDTCENHRLALPNKLFEYAAAGVPVVASDLPEMRRAVAELGLGRTVDARAPGALAAALRAALENRDGARPAAGAAALWARERERLLAAYAELLPATAGRGPALVVVRNPAVHDARVERAVRTLREEGWEPLVLGVVATGVRERRGAVAGAPLLRVEPGAGLRRRLPAPSVAAAAPRTGTARGGARAALRRTVLALDFYRRGCAALRALRPTLVHCNDWNTMWVGVAARLSGARVIYDAHELWADRNGRPEARPWLLAAEALFVRVADEVVTASPGYADVLARRYRIPLPRVVRNIPAGAPGAAGTPAAPAVAGAPAGAVATAERDGGSTLVYAGGLVGGRGLEEAIAALALLPGVRLRLIGPGTDARRAALRALAEAAGAHDRLELLDPVPHDRLVAALAGADAGLCLIQPVCRSYELTLPNKLFEYAAAGLPVLATDLPVIGRVVREHGLGELAAPGSAEAVAEAARRLLVPERNLAARRAAEAFARQHTWERERAVLAGAYAVRAR